MGNEPVKFRWTIRNFSKLNTEKHYSDEFKAGGYKWRLLVYPEGNNVDDLSLYLKITGSATLPCGWTAEVSFAFTVVDQILKHDSITKEALHQFDARSRNCWGFISFMPLDGLHDYSRGYLVNDTVIVEADIAVHEVCGFLPQGSIKETSCIQEKEEKRRHKAHQTDLYTVIKVARDKDFKEQIGRDSDFDLVDHDKVHSFHLEKKTPFKLFKEEVAKEFGISVQFQRFWLWARRQNGTYRPHRTLTKLEEAGLVGHLKEVNIKNNDEIKLFLEIELGLDLRPIAPPDKTNEDILLFFKLYDPVKGELRYAGRLFVKSYNRPIDTLARVNQMAGFAIDEEIELFEEIKFEPSVMCLSIDRMASFQENELENGDIICFQKSLLESEEECQYPDVPSFLEHVQHRQEEADGTNLKDKVTETELPSMVTTMAVNAVTEAAQTDETTHIPSTDSIFMKTSPPPLVIPSEASDSGKTPTPTGSCFASTTDSLRTAPSPSTVQMMSKNLLAELSRMSTTQTSASTTAISDSSQAPLHDTLKQKREMLECYFTSSLEAIHESNSFDNIESIALEMVKKSASSFERTVLKDLVSRLAKFKESVPSAISTMEKSQARRTCLSGQSADLSARLDKGREQLSSLENKYSKLSEEDAKLEAGIKYLMIQKEELLNKRNSVAQELEKSFEQVSADLEEWRNLDKETEVADKNWLQANEELAQSNLSWKLFKQNLEQCINEAHI